MVRRLAVLCASFGLIQLNVMGVERACAKPAAPLASEHAHHQGHDAQTPDQTPSQSRCCDAMLGCAMTFDFAAERAFDANAIATDRPATPTAAEHAAPIRAPDPPPPRA